MGWPFPLADQPGQGDAVEARNLSCCRGGQEVVRVGLGLPFGHEGRIVPISAAFGRGADLPLASGQSRCLPAQLGGCVTAGDIEVEAQIIATGHAWHYKRYDHTAALEAAGRYATAAARGLSAYAEPMPPWEWRRLAGRRGDKMKKAQFAGVVVGAVFLAALVGLLVVTLTWRTAGKGQRRPRTESAPGASSDRAVSSSPPPRPAVEPGAAPAARKENDERSSAAPDSEQVALAGTVRRPANGYKSDELDVAWQQYDEAISGAKTRLMDAMNRQLKRAKDGKRLNDAKKYSAMIDAFDDEGTFPTDCEVLRVITKTVRADCEKASRKLEKKYKDLAESLLKDDKLPNPVAAADAVDAEWANLANLLDAVRPPNNAVKIGKHSYRAYDDKVSQSEAVKECRQKGGYLARITEQEELDRVGYRLRLEKKKMQLWIDGTDAGKEGEWTALDGTPLGRIRWAFNQPDDANGRQNGLTVWVYEDKKLGWLCGMNDAPEAERHGYICEWDDVE